MVKEFFNEQTEQSLIKATLVAKYFQPYMRVIISAQKRYGGDRIAYIDLFAGPGRYKNGASSTPVKIIEQAIADSEFRKRLVAIFNDQDVDNVNSLERALKALPGIESLKHKPEVYHGEIDEDVVNEFEEMKLVPTLFFVDPWGYKGMTLKLINSVLKDWGCDCFFFFNYSRINAGLPNDKVEKHMDALFGRSRANKLRRMFEKKDYQPWEREAFIVEEMCDALKEMGGEYVLPFRFRNKEGTRITHHLFFVTKGFRGYAIMKEIMHAHATGECDGVVNFEYNPADKRQPRLFQLLQSVDELAGMLIEEFRGKRMTVAEIFERHGVGRRFVLKDYKQVLAEMYEAGSIQATRENGKPIRRNTFPEDIIVTFKPAAKRGFGTTGASPRKKK